MIAQVISSNLDEKDARGRKSKYDAPKDDIAQALGVGKGTLVRAEQHVETAEEYPFMQAPAWKQYHVLVLEARQGPGSHT